MSITLYTLPGCPFCSRVESKLEDLDLDYDAVQVPPSHDQRNRVEEVSGQTEVPVIVDEEHDVDGMNESADIVEYLEEAYGDGEAA